MPTYQYQREDGTQFEVFQKISEPALEVCPATGQRVLRVISGGGGVIYKGSGWYVTDYKNGGSSAKPATKEAATSTEGTPSPAPAPATSACATGACGHNHN
ncbi:MAG: FmdB family zinc ribbon protein [Chloroherpetonaceae bacterium]|nr:FmdB family zinc ribbon protein [Chloroherpetonaceae bacterium]